MFPSLPALYAIAKALTVHPARMLLDVRRPKDAIADAVLAADDATVARVAELLGVTAPKGRR